jgi:NodT family efflux transporter outer membrane factor (OMF) lipoprotein
VAAALLAGAGCAVGPDFKKPEPVQAKGYSPTPFGDLKPSGIADGGAQRLVPGQDIPFQWWRAFECPQLDTLVEAALRASPSIASAKAALRQAQELTSAQQGSYFPAVGGSYNVERQQLAGNLGGNSPGIQGNGTVIQTYENPNGPAPYNGPVTYTFHTAEVTVSYALDVFGENRRQVESLEAQAASQRYELEAAYLTLASNVVAAAIQEASTRAQIAASEDIIESNRRALEILRGQLLLGYAAGLDLAAQEAALAQAEQAIPPLHKQLEQTRDLIRALVGNLPDEDVNETFQLSALHLPEVLPLSLPSKIVEQRPDIQAAEEQMRSANAQVGVAEANRFPQITLSGAYGGAASKFSQMFTDGGPFWNLTGNVDQTIFAGGTLLHRQRAAEQAYVQAAAQYKSTVIGAFQNVADTLHALESDADSLRAAIAAEQAAKNSLELATNQYREGYINTLTFLTFEQGYQQAVINRVQALSIRFIDAAALFQALGGGWWNREARNP